MLIYLSYTRKKVISGTWPPTICSNTTLTHFLDLHDLKSPHLKLLSESIRVENGGRALIIQCGAFVELFLAALQRFVSGFAITKITYQHSAFIK